MTTPNTQELKLGRQARDLQAGDLQITKRAAGDGGAVQLSFSASSEAPVERWYGTEILSHDPKAVDMVRVAGGAAPLLFNHDPNDPIGMIDAATLRGGRLYVDAHLFATERAAEIAAMVEGGLRNVSIGYQVDQMTEETKSQTYTATRWTPLEVSIVAVPADTTVGIGRSAEPDARPVRVLRVGPAAEPTPTPTPVTEPAARAAAQPKELNLSQTPNAAAGTNADNTTHPGPRLTAQDAENQRREAIRALAEANKIDGRVEQGWIENGSSMVEVAREILDVQVQRQAGAKHTAAALGLTSKDTQRYSLFKAIRAMYYGARDSRVLQDAAFEIECSREVAKKLGRSETMNFLVPAEVLTRPLGAEAGRTMTTTPGNKGGYMVNVENMGFIDILRNRSVAMNMGARTLPGLVGNVSFARQTGKPSVTWQGGEGTSITAADQTLGLLSMTPKTAIAITDVSEQLLRQATPSAEAFVMADLAAVIAIDGVDNAVINGTGGSQPLGIKNTTGITTGQDASSLTYAKALAFPGAAAAANAILGNPGFVTNSAGAIVAMQRQRFTSTDTPIWQGNMMDGQLVGFRAMSSEQAASGNLIFGSWDQVVIGEWGVLELSMDNGGTRFNQGLVGIRAMWMVDVLLRYPQAFVVGTNLS
jgi:HK97 family phage major capsid protein/HK97 family phage prohead protease